MTIPLSGFNVNEGVCPGSKNKILFINLGKIWILIIMLEKYFKLN